MEWLPAVAANILPEAKPKILLVNEKFAIDVQDLRWLRNGLERCQQVAGGDKQLLQIFRVDPSYDAHLVGRVRRRIGHITGIGEMPAAFGGGGR